MKYVFTVYRKIIYNYVGKAPRADHIYSCHGGCFIFSECQNKLLINYGDEERRIYVKSNREFNKMHQYFHSLYNSTAISFGENNIKQKEVNLTHFMSKYVK